MESNNPKKTKINNKRKRVKKVRRNRGKKNVPNKGPVRIRKDIFEKKPRTNFDIFAEFFLHQNKKWPKRLALQIAAKIWAFLPEHKKGACNCLEKMLKHGKLSEYCKAAAQGRLRVMRENEKKAGPKISLETLVQQAKERMEEKRLKKKEDDANKQEEKPEQKLSKEEAEYYMSYIN